MANGKPLLKDKDKKEKSHDLSWWRKTCDRAMQDRGTKEFPKCEICGKAVNCMHHFFPKSVSARLRYDWDNLIPICQSCHMRHHQAGDPTIHATVMKKRGQAWYETLLKKKQEFQKVNVAYYKYILEMLRI